VTSRPHEAIGSPTFLFATCQIGAEKAVKADVSRRWPDVHAAFSRPGFLTFKVPADHPIHDDFVMPSAFARSHGISLGKTTAAELGQRVSDVWQFASDRQAGKLHVWQRDLIAPSQQHFSPSISPLAKEVEAAIRAAQPAGMAMSTRPAEPGDLVLDCVIVEPHEWWIGVHRASDRATCWPGGICELTLPPHVVSRAWLKMEEAIRWSEFPLHRGDVVAEIGCSPGGASQALLERGLHVLGVDPADVDPVVAANPHFTHLKKRGADVKRREFRDVKWLTADINVAPNYTLDTVEDIVTHESVNVRGMLLTLKLLEWELAERLPEYLERVAGWGYSSVRARQLSQNRQEVCVVATRK